jgi:DNA-binding SARP family transcriptional activator
MRRSHHEVRRQHGGEEYRRFVGQSAMGESAALRIELLDGFRVVVDGRPVPDEAWRRSKAAAVVKLLALASGRRLQREQAMDVLWPALDPAAAAANLRKALHYARRAAGDGVGFIVSNGDVLSLPAERLSVDVDAWHAAAALARRTGDPSAYSAAVELYGAGLLPDDRYEEWAASRRAELDAEFAALLEELAGLLESRGEIEEALRASERLVELEPLREQGHLLVIRLHALAGRRAEALRRYEHLSRLLESEFGIEPSAEAQRLYEEIRAGQAVEPELTAELWERVGELRVVAGDTEGAVKAFDRALAVADAPVVAGRLHLRAAAALLMQHDAGRAEQHLQAGERLSDDPAERARLVCLRANQAWELGDFERAQALAEWARDLALKVGDSDDVAAAQEALAIVSHFRGDWRHGLEVEIEHEQAGGGVPAARVFDIHHCIGQYHLYGDGLLDGVEDYARRLLVLAEEAQALRAQAFAWCLLGESLLLQARWEEAAGCLERSCDLHASLGTRSGALPWQRLAELAVCRGAPDEAEEPLRRASAIATVSPMARHMWGRIYATAAFAQVERADPEGAARSIRAADAAAARYGDCPSCSALLNPIAAETFALLGTTEAAAPYVQAAAGIATMFESSAWRAMAESAAASVARLDGETDRARVGFEAAASLYERAGQPYWQRRSLALAAPA